MAKVFIIEDYPITQQGITLILEKVPDLEACGHQEEAEAALEALKTLDPDLALVEIAVPGMVGLELIKQLHLQKPAMRILVLSRYDEVEYATYALRAGASGYLMKKATIHDLVEAIRRVLRGEIAVSDAISQQLLYMLSTGQNGWALLPSEVLSEQEQEVFKQIGQGFDIQEIADHMGLSKKTVESYRLRIKGKMHLSSSLDVMVQARAWVKREGLR